jgi:hypothetical protein
MSKFEFKPDIKKTGRNQYLGSWTESACKEIDLPFTKKSMITVLTWAVNPNDSEYSHQEIAHWCDRLHLDSEAHNRALESQVIDVAADIDAQWDMYLPNTYSLEELQDLDYSQVQLPIEWFEEWLTKVST